MRLLTRGQIDRALRAIFPDLRDWLPTDPQYLSVEEQDMAHLIDTHADPDNRFVPQLWECEEIAGAFVVDVRRSRLANLDAIPVDERFNLAIGEAYADHFRHIRSPHVANVFLDSNMRVLLCDLQTRTIWPASNADDVYFVRM